MNDIDIAQKAGSGDKAAFAQLFEKYKTFVWNVAYRMTYDFDEAEDLTQEVFIKVWENLNSFRGDSAFSTWIYRITVNQTLNRITRKPAIVNNISEGPLNQVDRELFMRQNPAASIDDFETERMLNNLLARINPERRIAIILYEIEGLSYEEIAGATKAPIGTVRSRIARGRKELEEMAALLESR